MDRVRAFATVARRHWEALTLLVVYTYGALLRFEALYAKYRTPMAELGGERLQGALADIAEQLRPASFAWRVDDALLGGHFPYIQDQRGYIEWAHSMSYFFDPHPREPLFVLLTKVALFLTGGQEVALSILSTFLSSLLIPAAFLLGRVVGGSLTGLIAASIVAIEYDLIWWGTDGWRDDLFALLVVLFAVACVRFVRDPSRSSASTMGVVAALTCLTRITALSLVLPVIVISSLPWLFGHAGRGRDGETRGSIRWREAGLAMGLVVLLVAPYLISCWVVHGDPFYTFTRQPEYYEAEAGLADGMLERVSSAPLATIDSMARGLTVYPFANKWDGLGHWSPGLGAILAALAVMGLLVWPWKGSGRMTLLVLLASMLPFAYVWELPRYQVWRLTLHTYPFFIVAAAFAVEQIGTRARDGAREPAGIRRWVRAQGWEVAGTAGAALLLLGLYFAMPVLIDFENLWMGRPTSVTAGVRDRVFFARGWEEPEWQGNQRVRAAEATRGVVRLPMLAGRGYRLLMRLGPGEESEPVRRVVQVRMNDRILGRVRLPEEPGALGADWLRIPPDLIRTGLHRLELAAIRPGSARPADPIDDAASTDGESAFVVWYLRLVPR